MKTISQKQSQKLVAIAFTASLAICSSGVFAGGSHDHKHAVEYDPVQNGFGMYKAGMHVTKVIEIEMSDAMTFSPSEITVNKGDVIKFVHRNVGQMMHEFVLGTPESLNEHAEMMKKFPGMEHKEPYMVHVAPGKKGEITWMFSVAGEFSFGCLIPGHYDAGMKGIVRVGS